MAHFLTIVIGKNPEDLLRPYWDRWEYDNPKGKYDWYALLGQSHLKVCGWRSKG